MATAYAGPLTDSMIGWGGDHGEDVTPEERKQRLIAAWQAMSPEERAQRFPLHDEGAFAPERRRGAGGPWSSACPSFSPSWSARSRAADVSRAA